MLRQFREVPEKNEVWHGRPTDGMRQNFGRGQTKRRWCCVSCWPQKNTLWKINDVPVVEVGCQGESIMFNEPQEVLTIYAGWQHSAKYMEQKGIHV